MQHGRQSYDEYLQNVGKQNSSRTTIICEGAAIHATKPSFFIFTIRLFLIDFLKDVQSSLDDR